jgi:hypothetical protein
MHCLHFSNAADGRWQEHTWLLGSWARVESTLHKLFISPSCWWGYGKQLLERFWPVAVALREILHICSRTIFTCSVRRSSIADIGAALKGAPSVSSQPFLMAFAHWQTVSYERACVPKLSFSDL